MIAIRQRDEQGGVDYHANGPSRIYANDGLQCYRIDRVRQLVERAIEEGRKNTIVEVGCGTCDITGPLSACHDVTGIDCNEKSLAIAKERFPDLHTLRASPGEPI